jgi:tetratricopeptide (TPR) repeat protein
VSSARTQGLWTTTVGSSEPTPTSTPLTLEDYDLARGTRLDRYVVLALRGRGGMGVVLEAFDPELDRKVAIKLLRPRGDPSEAKRLLREGRALARLRHPAVATIHDVGTRDDRMFIAMELIEGPTLCQWMHERRRSWREIRDMFVQAGEGLAAAHAAQIVHRDFKPSNVVVGEDGRPRVIDFGLAGPGSAGAALDASAAGHGDTTLCFAGTPLYMAPEVHDGARADEAADQYSFCVSLYEALIGRRPFGAEGRPALALAKLDPPCWSDRPRWVPRWLRQVVTRGMSPDPSLRYPSMLDLLAQLRRDPARRGLVAGLVASVVVGTAMLAMVARPEQVDAECGPLRERIDAAWSPEQRGRLERAVNDGSRVGESTWLSTDARIGAYVADLGRALDGACDVSLPPSERERRRECVLDRVTELEQLIDVSSEMHGAHAIAPVELTASAVASLTLPEECADRQVTGSFASREHRESARKTLARAEALSLTGRYAEGIALIEEVLRTAEQHGDEGLRARALLHLGTTSSKAGDYEAAAGYLAKSALTGEAVGEDWVAARAATAYVCTTGENLDDQDTALAWEPHAGAAIARVGPAPLLEAELAECLGMTHQTASDYEKAREQFERVLELRRANLPPLHLDLAYAYNNLANLEYFEGNTEQALVHARKALSIREQLLGEHHPEVGRALVTLSNTLRGTGHPDEALEAIRRAVAIERETLGNDHDSLATALNNLAGLLSARGELESAEQAYAEAQAIWERRDPSHPQAEVVRVNRASLSLRRGRFGAAEQGLREVLMERERRYGPRSVKLVVILANLGHAQWRQGKCEAASRHLGRAIEILEHTLGPDHPHAWGTWVALGHARACAKHPRAAREAYAQAQAQLDREASADPKRRAQLALGLARLDLEADPQRASERARAALQSLDGVEADLRGALASVAAMATARAGGEVSEDLVELARSELEAGGEYWAPEREAFEAWLAAREPKRSLR